MQHREVLRAAALALALLGPPARAHAQSPFRYDDDVTQYANPAARISLADELKYIPLGAPDQYLSFGADLRERIEADSNALLGFRDRSANLYDLHRILVFADLQDGNIRAFLQLSSATEAGRAKGPLPTDIDRGDLAQAFLDYTPTIAGMPLTLRGGRFEMAYDEGALIGLRDGPNVRQVWQGVQAYTVLPEARIDAFLVQPIGIGPSYFDDHALHGQLLWGVHLSAAPAALAPVRLTAFYYGNTMPHVGLYQAHGSELTHTLGLRLLATIGPLDGSLGGIAQFGHTATQTVAAHAAHADAGYTLPAPWAPRLGLRADALSGGNNTQGTLHTFNALYPNYAYSTEATIEAPANLIELGLTLAFHPTPAITINATLEGLWRYSTADAVYAAPTFPLIPPNPASQHRYTGLEHQLEATWHATPHLDLTAAYVHFEPGHFLQAAHAHPQDFGMSEIALHF